MGAFIYGWHVLISHPAAVLAFAICVSCGGALMVWLVRRSAGEFTLADGLSLSAASWLAPALLIAAVALLGQRLLGAVAAPLLIAALIVTAVLLVGWNAARYGIRFHHAGFIGAALLAVATIILAVLRLAFVQGLLLPQYFDSATHFGLVRQIWQWADGAHPLSTIAFPAGQYYHLGYHIFTAGIAGPFHIHFADSMLIWGQLVLAVIPVALYAIAHRLGRSGSSAFMAVILAATGWYMPAFAANWGKYPALFSVLPTVGAVTLALIAAASPVGAARRHLWILSAGVAAVAALIHTRSVVVILMAVTSAVTMQLLWRLPAAWRRVMLALLLLVMLALVGFILGQPTLRPALEPYYGSGIGPTLLAALLGAVALKHRPEVAGGLWLFGALLLVGLMVPVPLIGAGTLLDRPFVELWLFVPLSLLGADGFAGVDAMLGRRAAIVVLAVALPALAVHALTNYDLRASSCCTIVEADDLVALEWVSGHLNASDLVGIATEPLQLAPAPYPTLAAPVDAGAWVTPLTGVGAVTLPRDLDLREESVLQDLCQRGVGYIYVGGSENSFLVGDTSQSAAMLTARVRLPGAAVFEINCRS